MPVFYSTKFYNMPKPPATTQAPMCSAGRSNENRSPGSPHPARHEANASRNRATIEEPKPDAAPRSLPTQVFIDVTPNLRFFAEREDLGCFSGADDLYVVCWGAPKAADHKKRWSAQVCPTNKRRQTTKGDGLPHLICVNLCLSVVSLMWLLRTGQSARRSGLCPPPRRWSSWMAPGTFPPCPARLWASLP
jgi:hypothetical protein